MELLDLLVTGLIASVSSIVISEVYHRRSISDSKNSIDSLREDTDSFRDSVIHHIQNIDEDFNEESQIIINLIQKEVRALDSSLGFQKSNVQVKLLLFFYFIVFLFLSACLFLTTGNPVYAFGILVLYFVAAGPVYQYFWVSKIARKLEARYLKFQDIMSKYKLSFNERSSIEKWITRNRFDYLDQKQMLKILTSVPIYLDANKAQRESERDPGSTLKA